MDENETGLLNSETANPSGDPSATGALVDDPPIEFELSDSESESGSTDAGGNGVTPSTPPPAPATPTPSAADIQIRQLQAQIAELQSMQSPVRDFLQRQQAQNIDQPYREAVSRIERGQGTPEDLQTIIDYRVNQGLAGQREMVTSEARRASGEVEARALFTSEAMSGEGYAFDSIAAPVRAIYNSNPGLRDAVAMLVPQNPAVGEYLVGVMMHMINQHGGNVANAARAMLHGSQAAQRAASEMQRAQTTTARRTITQNRAPATRQKISARDIAAMSDEQFAELARQSGVSGI